MSVGVDVKTDAKFPDPAMLLLVYTILFNGCIARERVVAAAIPIEIRDV